MKRIAHFTIPALILLFATAVCAKVIVTPIQTGFDRYAWKFRPYRAATYWERGWPWVFSQYNIENPATVGGVLGPAAVYRKEYDRRALIGDLSVALAIIVVVGLWIFIRMQRARPWCFSIRGMLVVTTVIAACCGWWIHERLLWQREQTNRRI